MISLRDALVSSLRSVLTFIFFLALVLFGWGLDDLTGYFANPWRAGIVVLLLAQAGFRVYRAFLPERAQHHRLEHVGLYHLQVMTMETLFVIAPFCDRRGLTVMAEPVRGWGLALMAAGILLASWALLTWPPRLVMVDTLNELSPEHALSSAPDAADRLRGDGADFLCGPFRWLRFPFFAGQVLMEAGFGLAFRAWAGLLIAGLMLVILIVRTRQMDAIYLRYFGSAWDSYMQKTKRLVPVIF
jgi:protein-S-isoprenylcysteine O-methyltransferase Ste14